jgi:hypothetical protein
MISIQITLKLLLLTIFSKVTFFINSVRQKLVFEVYHFDKPPKLVGKAESTVGEIFGSPNNGLKKPLFDRNGKISG